MQAILTAFLVTMASATVFAGPTWANGTAVTIDTRTGKMVGLELNESLHFLGVRYAAPPTGSRRFMPPASPDNYRLGLLGFATNTGIWRRDMPQLQAPEVTYPTARMLATLPADGPNGKVFRNEKEYPMFDSTNDIHERTRS